MSARKLSIDDVKHRAEEVRDLARGEVARAIHSDAGRMVTVAVVGVLVVASVAYYLGTRRCGSGDATA